MEKRFTVMSHEYFSTGGNTMVSVFAVYDSVDNTSRYVIAGDESFSWQTADTVSNSDFTLDNDEMIAKIVIGSWLWDALTSEPCWDQHQFTEDEFELFKYCQFEHLKKDCKHFNIKVSLSVEELPNDLYNELSDDYIRWSKENSVPILTDGYRVYTDENYVPRVEDSRELTAVKDFLHQLDLLRYNDPEKLNNYITVAVAGDSVKIPMHADSYETLVGFLQKIIKDW